MNLKNKMSKKLSKGFIENLHRSIPLSSPPLAGTEYSGFKRNDLERLKMKELMNKIIYDETTAGFDLKAELEKRKALAYVNEIVEKPEKMKPKESEYFNRADELNAKFSVKNVTATKTSVRTGLLGNKVGMTMAWDKYGKVYPLTVVRVDNCQVTKVIKQKNSNFTGLELGMGHKDLNKTTKAMIGHFIKNDIGPKKFVKGMKVTEENVLPLGFCLSVRHFMPGQFVDVVSTSKGKGFQGVMTRWNFKGQFATHGNSLKHRGAVKIIIN